MAGMSSTRIMIVDDHEVARRTVRSALLADPLLDVVSEAANGEEAVKMAETLRPDIVLLDISLPGMSGIETATNICAVSPASRIIFVSQHDSVQTVRDALSAGAHGYVVKSEAGRDLLTAIEAAREGRTFTSRALSAHGRS